MLFPYWISKAIGKHSEYIILTVFPLQKQLRERVVNITLTLHLIIKLLAPELFFFLILAQPVYKMWIIQEPNTLELWNKLHFEEEKTKTIYHV